MQEAISIIAGVVFIAGFVPYIIYIIKNRHGDDEGKPVKATWLIWAVLDSITLTGMVITHTLNGQIIGAVTGAWIVVALSFFYGLPGWRRIDKWCLALAALAIALMFVNPTLGIVGSNTGVLIGSIPTITSAYQKPEREDKIGWTIYFVSCVLAVIAIPKWDFTNATQPMTFLVIETSMMWLLWLQPRFRKAALQT